MKRKCLQSKKLKIKDKNSKTQLTVNFKIPEIMENKSKEEHQKENRNKKSNSDKNKKKRDYSFFKVIRTKAMVNGYIRKVKEKCGLIGWKAKKSSIFDPELILLKNRNYLAEPITKHVRIDGESLRNAVDLGYGSVSKNLLKVGGVGPRGQRMQREHSLDRPKQAQKLGHVGLRKVQKERKKQDMVRDFVRDYNRHNSRLIGSILRGVPTNSQKSTRRGSQSLPLWEPSTARKA